MKAITTEKEAYAPLHTLIQNITGLSFTIEQLREIKQEIREVDKNLNNIIDNFCFEEGCTETENLKNLFYKGMGVVKICNKHYTGVKDRENIKPKFTSL